MAETVFVELRRQVEALMAIGTTILLILDRCSGAGITLQAPSAPISADDPRDRNLSIKDVAKLVGTSVSTIRRDIKCGKFPKGEHISERRVAWAYRDIEPHILQHKKTRKSA